MTEKRQPRRGFLAFVAELRQLAPTSSWLSLRRSGTPDVALWPPPPSDTPDAPPTDLYVVLAEPSREAAAQPFEVPRPVLADAQAVFAESSPGGGWFGGPSRPDRRLREKRPCR